MKKNLGRAFEYYERAAKLGFGPSCNTIGAFYHNGEFIGCDYQMAMQYYQNRILTNENQGFLERYLAPDTLDYKKEKNSRAPI